MAKSTVTIVWLDGFNQERYKTLERTIQDMPAELAKDWPNCPFKHVVRYNDRLIPAQQIQGEWVGWADCWL